MEKNYKKWLHNEYNNFDTDVETFLKGKIEDFEQLKLFVLNNDLEKQYLEERIDNKLKRVCDDLGGSNIFMNNYENWAYRYFRDYKLNGEYAYLIGARDELYNFFEQKSIINYFKEFNKKYCFVDELASGFCEDVEKEIDDFLFSKEEEICQKIINQTSGDIVNFNKQEEVENYISDTFTNVVSNISRDKFAEIRKKVGNLFVEDKSVSDLMSDLVFKEDKLNELFCKVSQKVLDNLKSVNENNSSMKM